MFGRYYRPQQNIFDNFTQDETISTLSPIKWSEVCATHTSLFTRIMSEKHFSAALHHSLDAEKALFLPIKDTIAAEVGSDLGLSTYKLKMEFANTFHLKSTLLSRISFFAKRGALILNVADKVNTILHSSDKKYAKASFKAGMQLMGSAATTMGLTLAAGSLLTVGSPFITGTAAMIALTASADYLAGQLAEKIEMHYENSAKSYKK